MAQCYGIILRIQGNGSWSIPAAQIFLERCRKVEQEDGDVQPMMVNSEASVGSATATK